MTDEGEKHSDAKHFQRTLTTDDQRTKPTRRQPGTIEGEEPNDHHGQGDEMQNPVWREIVLSLGLNAPNRPSGIIFPSGAT